MRRGHRPHPVAGRRLASLDRPLGRRVLGDAGDWLRNGDVCEGSAIASVGVHDDDLSIVRSPIVDDTPGFRPATRFLRRRTFPKPSRVRRPVDRCRQR
jgi:hypothetical protein